MLLSMAGSCIPSRRSQQSLYQFQTARLLRHPVDPFGMADVVFAQAPRGLAETASGPINRTRYQTP
ncbi:hypothetical protein, partial [Methylobacterium dankookense]|uniref:hypothetical protein n=1 Tax=Methylobacterium dankookense TaxID=560405 RepID=UPI001EE05700